MPENLTPSSRYSTTSPSIPLPGEMGGMQTGPAPMKPLLQQLANNDSFALLGVSGALVWAGDLSVESVVSASDFVVRIGAIQSVTLVAADGSAYDVYFYAGGTVGASKIEGAPGSLSPSTWYYVYAIPGATPGGACDFEISATAPRANRVFKTGSGFAFQSRRYLGAFRTDSNGAPFPMRMTRGRCLYRRGALAAVNDLLADDGLRAVDTSSATSLTATDVSSRIPPHARVVLVSASVFAGSAGSSGTNAVKLYTADDTAAPALLIEASASSAAGDTTRTTGAAEIETTSSRAFGVDVDKGTDVLVAHVDVVGWLE